MLDSAFRSTHRQHNAKDSTNRNITPEIRTYRNRTTTDGYLNIHCRKRIQDGRVQNTPATYIEHEDILNDILGRDDDATNKNKNSWLNLCRTTKHKPI